MSWLPAFALGFVGAFLVDLLMLYNLREKRTGEWPEWLSWKSYWILSSIGYLIGGVVAAAYSGSVDLNPLIALNVGAAWPVIVGGLAKTAGPIRANSSESN